MVRFAEKGMGGDILQTWHNKFPGTDTCEVKEELKVATNGAEEVLTWELIKAGLRTIACLETGFMYWYVGVVITFTTLVGRTETVLTEKLDKTVLGWTLTVHSIKWATEAFQIARFTETWTHSFLAPRERTLTEHILTTTGTSLMEVI